MSNLPNAAPLEIHRDIVRADWIDYNNHMNDGYYVVAFTYATDALQEHVGLGQNHRESTGCSIYTVEAHLKYLREVKVNTNLGFSTYVLGVDHKRLHLMHAMFNLDENYLAATHELMLLHVNQSSGKTIHLPGNIHQQLTGMREAHRLLPLPANRCQSMRKLDP